MPKRSQRRPNQALPPMGLASVGLSPNVEPLGRFGLNVASNGDNRLRSLHVYIVPTGTPLDKATALMKTIAVPSSFFATEFIVGDPFPTNLPNAYFDLVAPPPDLDLGYAVAGGQLSHPTTPTAAMYSSDGVTWTIRPTPIDATLGSLPYFDVCRAESPRNLWVAVANSGDLTKAVMTSPDGVTWTARTLPEVIAPNGIAYSPTLDRFVIAGFSGTNRGATSQDGITWVPIPVAGLPALSWRDVTWSPEKAAFCIVAQTSSTSAIAFSPDGLTWTRRGSAGQGQWQAVKWCKNFNGGAGFFVMVGNAGAFRTATAVDAGSTGFVGRATDQNMFFRCLGYSPTLNRAVAGGNSGTVRIATSTDGITWTDITATCGIPDMANWQVSDFKWIGDKFVMVANLGVATSTDGLTWTVQYQPPWQNWKALDYSVEQDRVVAVSQGNGNGYHVASWGQFHAAGETIRSMMDIASANGSVHLALLDPLNTLIYTPQSHASPGVYLDKDTPGLISQRVGVLAPPDLSVVLNGVAVYTETLNCLAQGYWDVYVFPANAYGIEGPGSEPIINVMVI